MSSTNEHAVWVVAEQQDGYQLRYHAGPEEESYTLQPGRGVTRYDYQQTGTTDQVVAVLEDFVPGQLPAPTTDVGSGGSK